MAVLLAILLVFVCVLLHYYYKNVHVFNKRLKRFATPPALPILGHALDFIATEANLDVLTNYVKNYGSIVRIKIGPKRTLLLISDCNFLQFILTSNKIIEKSIDYRNLSRWLGTGLLTGGGEKWKCHRKLITPAFHYKILEEFVDVFDRNGKILVEKLEQHQDAPSVNICPFITLCTLDIICESAMGKSIKAQENAYSDYVRSVKEMCRIIVERAFSFHKMFDSIYRFTGDYKIEQAALKVLHEQTQSVIVAKQNEVKNSAAINKDKKLALLDLMLSLKLTNVEVRQEVDTFMFAGHDTTGSALSFTLFCLANHQDVQERALKEQRKIFGENFLRPSTLDDLKSMNYLEMVIKESLRLYPPVPFFAREVDEDIIYDGEYLPKGLTLTMFVYALHRNPELFPEPEKFNPSRFEDRQQFASKPFAYLPFSAGPRNCIGSKFAMAELKSVLSRLIRHFELRPSIPQHHLQLASETVLISKNGICISLKKRS